MAEQGSAEWFAERLGFCTASKFAMVLRGEKKKTYNDYVTQVVAERLTKSLVDEMSNKHMIRGKEQEPEARMKYEMRTGNIVDQVGFIKHKNLMCGASPDGVINNEGNLEIKCVLSTVQIDTLRAGICPKIHLPQIQGNLWITGRKWCDFVSYSPKMPEPMNLFVKRVEADKAMINEIECSVRAFLSDVDAMLIGLLTEFPCAKKTRSRS